MRKKLRYIWINEIEVLQSRLTVSRLLFQSASSNFTPPNHLAQTGYYIFDIKNALMVIKRIGSSKDVRVEIIIDDYVLREPLGRLYDKFVFGKFGYDAGSDSGFSIDFPEPQFRVTSPVFFIGGRDNYSHFLYDFLPRSFIKSRFGEFDNMPICYVRTNPYQDQIFKSLGLKNYHPINENSDEMSVYFDQLLLPTGYPPSFAYQCYQEILGPRQINSKKIAIWKDSGNIRVINAADVRETLVDLGYDIFYPERHDFDTVLKTMGSSRSIVIFGDGSSANALFAPPSCRKLLIINEDFYYSPIPTLRASLEPLTALANLQVFCGNASKQSAEPQFDPYSVDVNLLRSAITTMDLI